VLTNAALFVLPSELEGLSLALLDAMGAGICVLTSDIPENREVVENAGFTFRAGDVDDLARMLALLLSNPQTRAIAGEMSQQVIRDRYLWPNIAKQIAQLYDETLRRQGHAPQNRAG
jgi:glycosyltransferase involved in cell wall biosynthesis